MDVPLITRYNTSVVYHGLLLVDSLAELVDLLAELVDLLAELVDLLAELVDLLAELLAELVDLALYNLLKGRETWLQTEFDNSIYVGHLNTLN